MEGKTISLKPRFYPNFKGKVYHCIWQLKIPPEIMKSVSSPHDVHVYFRILNLHMEGTGFLQQEHSQPCYVSNVMSRLPVLWEGTL